MTALMHDFPIVIVGIILLSKPSEWFIIFIFPKSVVSYFYKHHWCQGKPLGFLKLGNTCRYTNSNIKGEDSLKLFCSYSMKRHWLPLSLTHSLRHVIFQLYQSDDFYKHQFHFGKRTIILNKPLAPNRNRCTCY